MHVLHSVSSHNPQNQLQLQGKAVVVPPVFGCVALKPCAASCIFNGGMWSRGTPGMLPT